MLQDILDYIRGSAAPTAVYQTPRSPKWREVSHNWLKVNPSCLICKTKVACEVHHKYPFHLYPELELVSSNFRTLCRTHHFEIGHGRDWQAFNPGVDETVQQLQAVITSRIYQRIVSGISRG